MNQNADRATTGVMTHSRTWSPTVLLRGVLITLSVVLLAIAFKNRYGDLFRHSDLAWSVAFFQDLLLDHGSLANWNLSNHTDFFPDKLIALPLWLLTGQSYDGLILSYALISFTLWIFSARLLFGSFFGAGVSAAVILILMGLWISPHLFITPFFPTLHFPAFALALICLHYFLGDKTPGWARALSFLTLLGTFLSDRLIIIYAGVFVVSLITVDLIQKRVSKRTWLFSALFFAGAILILGVHDLFWSSFTQVSILGALPFKELIRHHAQFKKTWAVAIFFVVLLALAPRLRRVIARYPDQRTVFVGLLAAELIPVAVMARIPLETRYAVPSAYLAITALVCWGLSRMADNERVKNGITALVTVTALGLFWLNLPKTGGILYHVAEHPLSACLRDVNAHYPLKSGIGTYWNTHEVNLFGNEMTPVRAFGPDLSPYHWVNSRGFYRADFNFLVERDAAYSIDMRAAKKILGESFLAQYPCPAAGTDVYVLSPAQTVRFRAFLAGRGYSIAGQ